MSLIHAPCNGCDGRGCVTYDEGDLRRRADQAAEEQGREIYWRTSIPHGDHCHRVQLLAGRKYSAEFVNELGYNYTPVVEALFR